MAKPVGRTGYFQAQVVEGGSVLGSYQRLEFPAEKAEVESLIAGWFVDSMARASISAGDEPLFSGLKANPENDFDFTVATKRGPAYLELQEAAPLTGPYESAQASYKPYEYAKYILSKIQEKSVKYPKDGVLDLFLLIYVTHWSFVFSETTIACLRVWLQQEVTVFRAVFAFTPHGSGEGEPRWLYPVPPELREGFDPESVRGNVCLNLDSANTQIIQQRVPNPAK